jgi:ribosomal protein S1
MKITRSVLGALVATLVLWTGSTAAQSKPGCEKDQARVSTPQAVDGQVVKIDKRQSKVTVRGTDGATHEFQASKETLRDLKVGDRIEATLRSAPEC